MTSEKWIDSADGHSDHLNLFSLPITDTAIENIDTVEYQPISQLNVGNALEFNITSPTFIDLTKTRLNLKCKLVQLVKGKNENIPKLEAIFDTKTTPNADGDVGPVNALFYALWSQIDFLVQQQNISSSITTNGYAYKALIDLLTEKPKPHHKSVLFIKDTAGNLDTTSPFKPKQKQGRNSALNERATYTTGSNIFEMEGDLKLPLLEQNRLLLHNVNLALKLWPNNEKFYLMSPQTSKAFKLIITEAKLKLCHVTLNPAVTLGISESLKLAPALYPYSKPVVKTFNVATGSHSAVIDNVFSEGNCPDQLYVAMVDSSAYSGNFGKNPFKFDHFSLEFLGFYINNHSIPARPLQPMFGKTAETSNFTEAWLNLFEQNPEIDITHKEFFSGFSIFCLNLTQVTTHGIVPLTKTGHSKLELKWSKALDQPINILVYGKFKGLLSIDAVRNITLS